MGSSKVGFAGYSACYIYFSSFMLPGRLIVAEKIGSAVVVVSPGGHLLRIVRRYNERPKNVS